MPKFLFFGRGRRGGNDDGNTGTRPEPRPNTHRKNTPFGLTFTPIFCVVLLLLLPWAIAIIDVVVVVVVVVVVFVAAAAAAAVAAVVALVVAVYVAVVAAIVSEGEPDSGGPLRCGPAHLQGRVAEEVRAAQ